MSTTRRRCSPARERLPSARCELADLRHLQLDETFDLVTSRGVANDFLTDEDRGLLLQRLADHRADDGALMLDVRDAKATARRYGTPQTRRQVVVTPEGELEDTELEDTSTGRVQDGLLRFNECHELRRPTGTIARDHHTTMRPWSTSELKHRLLDAGITDIEIREGIGRHTTDRLLCVARHWTTSSPPNDMSPRPLPSRP